MKKLSAEWDSTLFRDVQAQFEETARKISLDVNVLNRLRVPDRALVVSVPFRMDDGSVRVTDTFLNAVRKAKTPLTIFLVNGVKLQGVVTWFDNFCVLLRRDGQVQLVYKHAISTIMPGAPVQLYEIDKAADEADA